MILGDVSDVGHRSDMLFVSLGPFNICWIYIIYYFWIPTVCISYFTTNVSLKRSFFSQPGTYHIRLIPDENNIFETILPKENYKYCIYITSINI